MSKEKKTNNSLLMRSNVQITVSILKADTLAATKPEQVKFCI